MWRKEQHANEGSAYAPEIHRLAADGPPRGNIDSSAVNMPEIRDTSNNTADAFRRSPRLIVRQSRECTLADNGYAPRRENGLRLRLRRAAVRKHYGLISLISGTGRVRRGVSRRVSRNLLTNNDLERCRAIASPCVLIGSNVVNALTRARQVACERAVKRSRRSARSKCRIKRTAST